MKKTQNIQQVLSQDNILLGFGLSPSCFFFFFFFFFDLPPEEGRKVTPACLFRYSFIYICPPLDCSFLTVMRLLANGKIQRGDPLFFSFMISPANIFLHASETFRLCIKKYEKGKKNSRLQLDLPMLSSRHPAATTCTEPAGFICHSCCLIGAVGGFTYGGESCINTQHRHTHTHTKNTHTKPTDAQDTLRKQKKTIWKKFIRSSSSIHLSSIIIIIMIIIIIIPFSSSSLLLSIKYPSRFLHIQRQSCFLFYLPSLNIFNIFCVLWCLTL